MGDNATCKLHGAINGIKNSDEVIVMEDQIQEDRSEIETVNNSTPMPEKLVCSLHNATETDIRSAAYENKGSASTDLAKT